MSRKRESSTIPIEPKWMPLLAQRMLEEELGYIQIMTDQGMDVRTPIYTRLMHDFPSAQLWWVDRDMTKLAIDTAEDEIGFDGTTDVTVPARTGITYFEGGLPIHISGKQAFQGSDSVRITGLYWDYVEGHFLFLLISPDCEQWLSQRFHSPLHIYSGAPLPGDKEYRFLIRLLAATWALSEQETISRMENGAWDEQREQRVEPKTLTKARQTTPDHMVRLIRLKPSSTTTPHASSKLQERREYECRWIVRGHYRNQPYGPAHALRRRQWIPPYVAGPEDKPLHITPTVHVWAA